MSGLLAPEWQKYYHGGFTIASHELLAWGYRDARSEIKSSLEEEAISKAIVRAIQVRLNAFETPEKFANFFAEVETHPMEDERAGKNCPRIDIKILSSATKPRPQFTFEAKRLKKGSHTISGYTGKAGIGCFLCCQYAENFPSAAMIGYMQDADSIVHWTAELKRSFEQVKELSIIDSLQECKVHDELPNEWLSKHGRMKNNQKHSDIGIYHILLDCCG